MEDVRPRLTAEQVDRLAVLLRPYRHLMTQQNDPPKHPRDGEGHTVTERPR